MDYLGLLRRLTPRPSITGFEQAAREAVLQTAKDFFDSAEWIENVGVLCRRAGKKTGKRLLLDAHLDEIGLITVKSHPGGFLSALPLGGIDPGVLPAGEVVIYGKETIRGVVSSTPPHLIREGEGERLLPVSELLIDTGYSQQALDRIVRPGTPIGYLPDPILLKNGRICSKGLDNKCCILSILSAMRKLDGFESEYEICALFSIAEELSGLGARAGAARIKPDVALIVDVNHAFSKGFDEEFPIYMAGDNNSGGGCAVSRSASVSREVTDAVLACAEKNKIPHCTVAEPSDTGTNAARIAPALSGIPCAVLSVPLKYMHTQSEVVSPDDIDAAASLIGAFAKEAHGDFTRKVLK